MATNNTADLARLFEVEPPIEPNDRGAKRRQIINPIN